MEPPRLALATAATEPDPSIMSLALLAGLRERGWRVQHFRTRACPTVTEVVGHVTGLPGRHLDSWLMPESLCRSLFVRGSMAASLAVVEGTLETPQPVRSCKECELPGELGSIARTLNLPVVLVLSMPEGSDACLHLPQIPEGIDAVLIDRLTAPEDLSRLRRTLRLTRRIPVLGALECLPGVRQELERTQRADQPPDDLVQTLAHNFLRHADLEGLAELSRSRPFPGTSPSFCACGLTDCHRCFRVAYAQDDAFGRYFPDTLEALEALGAELVEFSPLRDEALPEDVDLVMIGCGVPDLHADRLAANVSMTASLRQHVCRGKRIYTEGGGAAYLGLWMRIGGQAIPGAGILPFTAELRSRPAPPTPVSRVLLHDSWLGPSGTKVRGYKSGRWRFHPSTEPLECPDCVGTLSSGNEFFYHHHAVGSLIHLHLGALPEVVAGFAGPHQPSLRRPSVHGLIDPS